MSNFTQITLPTFVDERGALSVLEGALPFKPVRMYWIYSADGKTRGGHRHRVTRQALIAIHGTVTVYLNDGITKETVVLDQPGRCLLVEPKDWHTMTFGSDSVLLVMASHHYDRSEYIDAPYGDEK